MFSDRTRTFAKIALLLPAVLAAPMYFAVRAFTPQPWDETAVTATFDKLALDKTATNLEFHYTLRNHSRSEFHHELGAPLVLIPHSPPADPTSALGDPHVDFPIDAPPGSVGTLVIRASIVIPRMQRQDPNTAEVEDWLRVTLTKLDGFTLTDPRHRFVIRLPKGW